jgi:hypothetical protein
MQAGTQKINKTKTMKEKLLISFSGGRTSAYMTYWLLNEWEKRKNYEIIVTFANTGKEAEETLFFVDECANEWGIEIIWLEAKFKDENGITYSDKGWKVNHKVVNYETASRNGEPFEEMISILGIPRTDEPFCSRQLKTAPIESYLKSIRWKNYYRAIGIRFDELNRLDKNRIKKKFIYPFADIYPVTKSMVSQWWGKQDFDLKVHPDEGNCDNCWKKDFPRLARNMQRNPKSFEWWAKMENEYGHFNPRNNTLKPPFNFYRNNKSTIDIRRMSELSQAELKQITMFDPLDGCSESCEAF